MESVIINLHLKTLTAILLNASGPLGPSVSPHTLPPGRRPLWRYCSFHFVKLRWWIKTVPSRHPQNRPREEPWDCGKVLEVWGPSSPDFSHTEVRGARQQCY